MRKIKVIGCFNCPYMKPRLVEGAEKMFCEHPSFIMDGVNTEIKSNLHPDEDKDPESLIPAWCPLEFDTSVLPCNPCGAK